MGKITITKVEPEIDGGRYPVKRESDRAFEVYADIISSASVKAWLKYRKKDPGGSEWERVPMEPIGAGRWKGGFSPWAIGAYQYTVEAAPLPPLFRTLRSETKYRHILEVVVDPVRARFAAWYRMWARSQGKIEGKSATFKDMEERLQDIKEMGFDVIFLPPIHPIGRTNRKGANNTLIAGPHDPGSPFAVGNELGGHKSIDPDLGTMDDFRHFAQRVREMGLELALDVGLQSSPDHPYVKEHPGWFYRRPDGTIAYAENPPKKYQDVYPLNFYPADREAMWQEMKSIFTFWIKEGIKNFRVDNPHTKPTEFWEWLIKEIKREYPEAVFLAEAFTYYERLELHAKVGFSQSYTYFTWRNRKDELMEYFTKLTRSYLKEFLRGNLFVNDINILPRILQEGGRPAFKMRVALAATLSSLYGIYNGYELCENDALPETEDYRNSEVFQYKVWDWDRPGNIKDYIAKLNWIRRENPALHYYDNLRFYDSVNEHILFYGKVSPNRKNILLLAVNLDPFRAQQGRVTVPVEEFGLPSDGEYRVRELITDRVYTWQGRENYVRLDPSLEPAYIFRIEKGQGEEEEKSGEGREPSLKSRELALAHARLFFELREKALEKNDVSSRIELERLYQEEITPRVYTGPTYDRVYTKEIDRISKKHGCRSIIVAYLTTPGH